MSGVAGNRRLVLRLPVLGRYPALFFELSKLVLLPLAATLDEEAFQQFACWLDLRMTRAPVSRQRSFHRRLEDRGPIEPELVSRLLKRHGASVEIGKQLVELFPNARLFRGWCDCYRNYRRKRSGRDTCLVHVVRTAVPEVAGQPQEVKLPSNEGGVEPILQGYSRHVVRIRETSVSRHYSRLADELRAVRVVEQNIALAQFTWDCTFNVFQRAKVKPPVTIDVHRADVWYADSFEVVLAGGESRSDEARDFADARNGPPRRNLVFGKRMMIKDECFAHPTDLVSSVSSANSRP